MKHSLKTPIGRFIPGKPDLVDGKEPSAEPEIRTCWSNFDTVLHNGQLKSVEVLGDNRGTTLILDPETHRCFVFKLEDVIAHAADHGLFEPHINFVTESS